MTHSHSQFLSLTKQILMRYNLIRPQVPLEHFSHSPLQQRGIVRRRRKTLPRSNNFCPSLPTCPGSVTADARCVPHALPLTVGSVCTAWTNPNLEDLIRRSLPVFTEGALTWSPRRFLNPI